MRQTVAIIDSDATTLHTLRTLLNTLDAEVQIFDSAESFFARYAYGASNGVSPSPTFACLIVDATLPGLSGLQLLKRVRSSDPEVPVIVLASEAEVALAVEAMRYGATDFIEKPQLDVALLRRVSQLLRNGVDATPHKNAAGL